MNLFEIEGDKLRIQPEAYALLPFKKIWDRDKSKGKVIALVLRMRCFLVG